MQHADIFFSYSRDDGEFVLRLASALREQGVNLWLDQLDIEAGERWDLAVEKALESCHTLIVVLSPTSVDSVNVMDEVSYALQSDKRVVPVLSRACTVPFRLRRVQHIDFVEDYDRGFKRLIQALRGAPGNAAASPAVAPLDRLPSRVEPAADRISGGPESRPGKRLAVGIGAVAVLALVSFLVLQLVPRGNGTRPPGPTADTTMEPVEGSYYRLQSKEDKHYVDAAYCTTKLVLSPSPSDYAEGACELFRFIPAGGGWSRLQMMSGGNYLSAATCSTEVSLAEISGAEDGACQLWRLVPAGGGWNRLQLKYGQGYLDACSPQISVGPKSDFEGGACQLWRLVPK